MNQKEEADALGKSRQVNVFWNTEGLGVWVSWENGDTIGKTKMKERLDLGGMSMFLERLDFDQKHLYILDGGLEVRMW